MLVKLGNVEVILSKFFLEKYLLRQNNFNLLLGFKVFKQMDVSISSDGITYTPVEQYTTVAEQRNKNEAYPVVCNLGDVVTQHLRMSFTKDGDWLLISEVVFLTDTYPPKPVIPDGSTIKTTSNTNSNNNGGDKDNNGGGDRGHVFTFSPVTTSPSGDGAAITETEGMHVSISSCFIIIEL